MFAEGQEGTLVKDFASIWEGKRRKDHIKLKGLIDCDLRVIGWEAGTGKNEGKIGALVVSSEDGLVVTRVGTGLKDADRAKDPSYYMNKIVRVTYNERIKNKAEGSVWALFLPRFGDEFVRLDKDAADTKALIGDVWLQACSKNGKIYGIPTYKPIAITPMVVYRQDIADKLGIDMSKVKSIDDMTAVLEQVKKAEPNMTPLAPVQTGEIGISTNYGNVDFLTDDRYKPTGVLIGDDTTVQDLYSSDLFKKRCELVRSWYNEGLVMKDAATTTSAAAELMSSGNYFCYIAGYSYPEKDTAASLQAQCGKNQIGAKIIGDAYLSTSDINAVSWMVASTSKAPEAALKFLNLTYTDENIINLLIYGVEGRDYVKNDDGTVSYPEGQDASTVPYTAQLSCGTLGNYFKMYPMEGTDPNSVAWELEQNKSAKTSPAMGFTFDAGNLKTQYTAVDNVISQYLPGLICGSLDPDTEIAKFVQALNDAGYQDILKAKQEQLDSWKSAK